MFAHVTGTWSNKQNELCFLPLNKHVYTNEKWMKVRIWSVTNFVCPYMNTDLIPTSKFTILKNHRFFSNLIGNELFMPLYEQWVRSPLQKLKFCKITCFFQIWSVKNILCPYMNTGFDLHFWVRSPLSKKITGFFSNLIGRVKNIYALIWTLASIPTFEN